MSTDNVEIVLTAQDRASKPIQKIEGNLLGLTKSARLMHREAYGVSRFANALDTVAGTRLSGLINDVATVAEVAHPLKDLGAAIASDVSTAWSNAAADHKVLGAVDAAGKKMASGLGSAISSPAGMIAIGAGLAVAFDQANADAAGKIKGLGEADARIYSGSFSDTMFSSLRQVLYGAGLQDTFGPNFRSVLDQLAVKSAEGAGTQIGATISTNTTVSLVNGFNTNVVPAASAAGTDVGVAVTDGAIQGAKFDAAAAKYADIIGGSFKSTIVAASGQTGQDAGKAVVDGVTGAIADNKATIISAAYAIDGDLASALQGNKGVIKTAMDKVKWAINHPLAEERQAAKLEGAITHIKYLEAVASSQGQDTTIFDQQLTFLENQWSLITGSAWNAGNDAGKAWVRGYQQVTGGDPTGQGPLARPGRNGTTSQRSRQHHKQFQQQDAYLGQRLRLVSGSGSRN